MNNNLLYINNNQLFNEIVLNKHVDINLQLLTIGSGKKIWWKCKKGHQWQTSIRKRCKENQGCPFCCGKKVCIDNCLYTTQNNLCKEWNYNKNLHLTPYSVTTHSNKKVWWKCNKNHEWKTSVEERVRGRGCPYCCGKKVCIDNSLLTKNPILCQEWNYEKNENLTPNNFTQFSAKKVWWKCEKGHEWQAMISNRSSGTGCKKCNNPNVSKIEKKFFHFFKLVFPEAENSYYFYYNGKRIEIDIFIKSLNLGIECDGGYVHSKERVIKNDIFKNNVLTKCNIPLIRIREDNLPSIQDKEYYYIHRKNNSIKNTIVNVLNYLIENYKLTTYNLNAIDKIKKLDFNTYDFSKIT